MTENTKKTNDRLCEKEDCLNYFYPIEKEVEKQPEVLKQDPNIVYSPYIPIYPVTGTAVGATTMGMAMTSSGQYTVSAYPVNNVVYSGSNWVNNSPISADKDGKFKIKLPCFSEFGIDDLSVECLMCKHLKKPDMSETLIIHKAKEELKK